MENSGLPHSGSILRALVLLGAIITGSSAQAQTCSLSSASGSYGNVNVLSGAAADITSTFTVTCAGTKSKAVRLCIEMAAGVPGDAGKRALSSGTNFLDHEFYSDSSRTQVWGSWGSVVPAYGSGGLTQDLTLDGNGNGSQTFTLYARVLANQSGAAPLSYSWSGVSPGIRYAYTGRTVCPTGSNTATGGNTTWTATVPANCAVSATGVNFGSSGPIRSNVDAAGTVSVQCTNSTPYSVALSGGNSGATDPTRRKMSKATETITYGLYQNAARTQPWGSTTGSNTLAGTGSGTNQALSVYGRVAAQTTPSPGTYTDTVVVTVTY